MEVTEKPKKITVLEEQQEDQISLDLITAEESVEAEGSQEKGDSSSHADIVPTNSEISSQNLYSKEIVEAEEIEGKGFQILMLILSLIMLKSLLKTCILGKLWKQRKSKKNAFPILMLRFDPTNVELSAQSSHSDPDYEARSSPEVLDTIIRALADDFTMQIVLGVSSILLTLAAAAAASFYLKKSKVFVSEAEILKQPLSPKKMTSDSGSASSQSHTDIDRPLFYQNCPAEVEMVGESGPLEMSSSLEDSFSTSQRGSDRVESKSNERKLRRNSNRESMVSSSEDSAGSPSITT